VAVIYLQNAEIRRSGDAIATDPLLVIEHQRELTDLSPETLRVELMRLPQVSGVTATQLPPLTSGSLPLARTADDGAPQRMFPEFRVSHDFASVLQLNLLAGRFFERERADDGRDAAPNGPDIVIDRALTEFLGFARPADAVGESVYVPKDFMIMLGVGTNARPMRVIGVVENRPLAFLGGVHTGAVYRLGSELGFTIARLSRDDVPGALEEIDGLWGRLAPGVAVSRRFIDEAFQKEYAQFARIATAMTALCSFAVLIAIVGLFAMTQVVVARRSREIAVRKVLGAETPLMVVMMLKGFALLVLAASLAAWPVAYIAMRNYLNRFTSPINLDVTVFATCLLGMLLVASLTVGAQIIAAARLRPSAALRHE
jgi:putative ABC transport system permease protein